MNTGVCDNSKTMEVKEFSYKVLSAAVDFMYGIEIPEEFDNEEDLKSLLHMADLYLMEDLKDAAGFLIGKTLNQSNVFDLSKLADKFGAMLLSDQCVNFFYDNHTSFEDDNFAVMKDGTVMAALAMKMMKESKNSWMAKLFGDKPDFKRREDFGNVDAYKSYVRPKIQLRMFARCNKSSIWRIQAHCGSCLRSCNPGYCQHCRRSINSPSAGTVSVGHVGFISKVVDQSGSVEVKWLTMRSGDEAHQLLNHESTGAFECLDLLTNPVGFNI